MFCTEQTPPGAHPCLAILRDRVGFDFQVRSEGSVEHRNKYPFELPLSPSNIAVSPSSDSAYGWRNFHCAHQGSLVPSNKP